MKPEVQQFVEEMLGLIRRDFFCEVTPKRFFQERPMLIKAICYPARWMKERGMSLRTNQDAICIYRRILVTVIQTIKRHGNLPKIHCFGRYLLTSVQEHMRFQGEGYYEQAKAARPIAAVLPGVTRHVRPGLAPDRATETLAQMSQILRSKGGRRRAIQVNSEGDLFSSCKSFAPHMQNRV